MSTLPEKPQETPPAALVEAHAAAKTWSDWYLKWAPGILPVVGILMTVFVAYGTFALSRYGKQLDEITDHGKQIAELKGLVQAANKTADRQYEASEKIRAEVMAVATKTALIDKIQTDAASASASATQAAASAKLAVDSAEKIEKQIGGIQAEIAQLKQIKEGVEQTRGIVANFKPVVGGTQVKQVATLRVPLRNGKALVDVGKFAITEVTLPLDDIPLLAKPELRRGLEIVSAEIAGRNSELAAKLSVFPSVDGKYENVVLSIWSLKEDMPQKFDGEFQVLLSVSWPAP